MKKILLIILFCVFLSSCRASNTIYYDTYIASIGIKKTNDSYIGYFYLLNSIDVGNNESSSSEGRSEVAVTAGNSISDLFYNLEISSMLKMNFMHTSSVILDISMLNNEDINNLIDFVREYKRIDLNFYLFSTNNDISELYDLKNPNNENLILTLISEPVKGEYICLSAKPIHFLSFCRDYYEGKVIRLPLLEKEDIWDNSNLLYCDDACLYIDNYYRIIDYSEGLIYLKSNECINYTDSNISCELINYKFDIIYLLDTINIKFELRVLNKFKEITNEEKYIKRVILEYINNLINYDIDILNLKYYKSKNIDIKINIL